MGPPGSVACPRAVHRSSRRGRSLSLRGAPEPPCLLPSDTRAIGRVPNVGAGSLSPQRARFLPLLPPPRPVPHRLTERRASPAPRPSPGAWCRRHARRPDFFLCASPSFRPLRVLNGYVRPPVVLHLSTRRS